MHEAKTHLSRLVDEAAAGEEIVIARAGKPVARLMPLAQTLLERRPLGLGRSRYTMPADCDQLHAKAIDQMFEIVEILPT